MREILKTYEFDTFLKELDDRTISKFDQVIPKIRMKSSITHSNNFKSVASLSLSH